MVYDMRCVQCAIKNNFVVIVFIIGIPVLIGKVLACDSKIEKAYKGPLNLGQQYT